MGSYNRKFFRDQAEALEARLKKEKSEWLAELPIALVKTNIPEVKKDTQK